MRILAIIFFISSFVLGSHGQQNIPIITGHICDTANVLPVINAEIGYLRCMNWKKDEVLYFTSKREYSDYYNANRVQSEKCDNEKILFDFKKYDLLIIRLSTSGCNIDYSFQVTQARDHYNVNLNFKQPLLVCALQSFFYRYVLIPKNKKKPPVFTIYNTAKKCY